jgi:two-component system, NarL family, sensor histidine kinase DesK
VYLPLFWYQWDWGSTQCMFLASVAMLLRGRLMNILIITPLLGTFLACVISGWVEGVVGFGMYFYVLVYWGVGLVAGAACLYGTSQLVRAVDVLFATRADMAEMTVGSERLRVSRDLHDLLGQSLSAVSLKGDLALLLLQSDPPAAEAEIRSLTEVAREALRDIRRVVHGEHPVTLRTETQGATALLVAASIDAHIEVELPGLVPEVDELFGWAMREGITNILRHSQAAHCSITVSRQQRVALLEIVNDGARYNHGAGTGITGLIERAQLLSGHVTAGPLEDGRFRLSLEIPEAFL